MADAKEPDVPEEDAGEDTGQQKKKGGGLAALLPKLLKIVAFILIGLIAVVGISLVTVNIAMSRGQAQTAAADPSSPYLGKRPIYVFFTTIGAVRTRTADPVPYSVNVQMNVGYDEGDNATSTELNGRIYELRDFVRTFFAEKTAAELAPANQARLKQEIIEYLNTRLLSNSKVRIITFDTLDVTEM
ncbi:MAG: flagellar basal body protein FliL [Spirochaetaceae bacterium]|jgi:flagellar FliL protein|nr:flagellar basal body protein FliL [Spirochaetaceae bacterium]